MVIAPPKLHLVEDLVDKGKSVASRPGRRGDLSRGNLTRTQAVAPMNKIIAQPIFVQGSIASDGPNAAVISMPVNIGQDLVTGQNHVVSGVLFDAGKSGPPLTE